MVLHGNTSTQCPECGKRFSRFASFKAHILLHIEDDILTCPHCDNEFETSRALSHHLDEEHRFESTPLKSKVSNMTLTELNSPLSSNQPTQNNSSPSVKTYLCKQCAVQFDTFRALKDHSRLHKKVLHWFILTQWSSIINQFRAGEFHFILQKEKCAK